MAGGELPLEDAARLVKQFGVGDELGARIRDLEAAAKERDQLKINELLQREDLDEDC